MSMTQEQKEWADRIRKGRRFCYPTFVIKDHYNDPDAPYFASAGYIGGIGHPYIELLRDIDVLPEGGGVLR